MWLAGRFLSAAEICNNVESARITIMSDKYIMTLKACRLATAKEMS
jgi:hypothetical protein